MCVAHVTERSRTRRRPIVLPNTEVAATLRHLKDTIADGTTLGHSERDIA